jgi:hypothetical protein
LETENSSPKKNDKLVFEAEAWVIVTVCVFVVFSVDFFDLKVNFGFGAN